MYWLDQIHKSAVKDFPLTLGERELVEKAMNTVREQDEREKGECVPSLHVN